MYVFTLDQSKNIILQNLVVYDTTIDKKGG